MILELLEWILGVLAFYIVLFTTITHLSIKFPILEKVAVWGLRFLPLLSNFIGKSLLNKMGETVKYSDFEVILPTSHAYPSLIFEFNLDSKAPIKLKTTELTAYVYLTDAFMGKIHWSRNELLEIKNNRNGLSIDRNYELDEVPDLKANGKSKIRLNFSSPIEIFKSEYLDKWHNAHNWQLEVLIKFSSSLGDLSKKFACQKFIDKNLEKISKHFAYDSHSGSK